MSTRLIGLMMLLAIGLTSCMAQNDACSRTSAMEIYSNAFVQEYTGDVLGTELAMRRHPDSSVEAFLYYYEGAPNKDGIPLAGKLSGKNLTLHGDWSERLIEYPSKKESVTTRHIKVDGVLDQAFLKGQVTIDGLSDRDRVRLKRVKKIWLCR